MNRICRLLPLQPLLATAFLAGAFWAPFALADHDESDLFRNIVTVEAASRFEQPNNEAPASVSVITSRDIERYGYRTLGALLDSVRGFSLTGDRNYSYLGVRGFPRAGSYNTRILVLLDGQRINDALYEDAAYGQDALIDVSMIDHVEVIRGPGSSSYGSGALFATINIATRRGRDLDGNEAALTLGSLDTRKVHASTGRRTEGGLEYVLSFSDYDSQGQKELFFPAFNTPANNFGIARDADGERAQHLFGKARLGNLTLTLATVQRVKNVPTASFGTVFNDNRYQTRDERSVLQAHHDTHLDSRFTGAVELHTNLSLVNSRYSGYYPVSLPPVTINRDEGISNSWNVESFAIFSPLRDHRVTAGVDYRRNTRLDQNNADIVQRLQASNRSTVVGLYAHDEWRIGDMAIVNLGLRRDRYTAFGADTVPRGALILKLRPQVSLKFMTGRAFRVPNAYEMYYSDGSTQLGNPLLTPERILTREVALEYGPTERFNATASLYRNKIDDFIRQVTDAASGLRTFRNMAQVNAAGFEMEARWESRHGVELRAARARQRNSDALTGASVPGMPNWTTKLNASAPWDALHARASMAARFVSARSSINGQQIPGYGVFDLSLQVAPPSLPGLRLVGTLYNAFDKRYGDPGGLEHTQDSIPADGRVISGRVEYAF